jgi:hypothetical protein
MSKASEDFLRREHKRIFGDDAIDDETENDAEHQRLQLAVVEAAKEWYRYHGYIPEMTPEPYETPLITSTRALVQFEAEQKNGNT